jgi:hypothetical protein
MVIYMYGNQPLVAFSLLPPLGVRSTLVCRVLLLNNDPSAAQGVGGREFEVCARRGVTILGRTLRSPMMFESLAKARGARFY